MTSIYRSALSMRPVMTSTGSSLIHHRYYSMYTAKEEAIDYWKDRLKSNDKADKSGQGLDIARTCNKLGIALYSNRQYKEALPYFYRAESIFKRELKAALECLLMADEASINFYTIRKNIAHTYRGLGYEKEALSIEQEIKAVWKSRWD